MRLWIDVQTHVVLAKEAYHSDGSLAWSTRYEDIRYTDDIPQSIFSSATPPGFVTVHGRSYQEARTLPNAVPDAGFKPVTPKYLPDGFVLSGADVSQIKGVRNLHLIYSDGIRTISLFENATDRAIDFAGLAPGDDRSSTSTTASTCATARRRCSRGAKRASRSRSSATSTSKSSCRSRRRSFRSARSVAAH